MKKVILNIVAASMICFNYACNTDNTPKAKEVKPVEPVESAEPIVLTLSQGGKVDATFNISFLYMIKEKSTGAILLIGRMDEPKE